MLTSRGGGDFTFLPIISVDTIYSQYNPEIALTALTILKEHSEISTVIVAVAVRHLFQITSDSSLDELKSNPNHEAAKNGLSKFIDELAKLNRKIILLVDNPTLAHSEDCIFRKSTIQALNFLMMRSAKGNCELTYGDHLSQTKKYREILTGIASNHPQVVAIFDQSPYLCDLESKGICSMTKNGRPLYGFTDHISDYAAGIIGGNLNQWIQDSR